MVKPVTRVVKNVASPVNPGRATRKTTAFAKKSSSRQSQPVIRSANNAKTGRLWKRIKAWLAKLPSWNDLSKDRQLDIIGAVCIVVGLLTLLSLLTEQEAVVSARWEWGWGPTDDEVSIRTIHKALDQGVNWIDTAACYGLEHAEEVAARAIKDRRDNVIVATKCGRG